MIRAAKIFALVMLIAILSGCAGANGQLGITTNEDAYVHDRRGE